MYISKNEPGLPEVKTLRSQMSNIDIFSKLESSFLEKFFKYNLSDYFEQYFVNLYEGLFDKKIRRDHIDQNSSSHKLQKYLTTSLFMVQEKITVQELENNIQRFYRDRSVSVSKNQLPFAFKLKYSSLESVPNLLNPGQLVFVDVKIKAEVQRIEELPQKILRYFEGYRVYKKGKLTSLQQTLANYKQQYFNIFVIYFGDSNFQIFNKKKYQTRSIKLMGNFFKLRIFAFYVSKQALMETFKSVNKIQNLESINDLVIQFYEFKREKQRKKRTRRNTIQPVPDKQNPYSEKIYMFIGVFGLVGFGFAIRKLFL